MVRYVIYEIDEDKFWSGGNKWTNNLNSVMTFKTPAEAEAAMRGLYKRSSQYNLMYKKIYL
jgi:hypothetical protein